MAYDLLQHARLWRLENMSQLFAVMPVGIRTQVLTIADAPYEASLKLGAAISLLVFLALAGLAAWQRRSLAIPPRA